MKRINYAENVPSLTIVLSIFRILFLWKICVKINSRKCWTWCAKSYYSFEYFLNIVFIENLHENKFQRMLNSNDATLQFHVGEITLIIQTVILFSNSIKPVLNDKGNRPARYQLFFLTKVWKRLCRRKKRKKFWNVFVLAFLLFRFYGTILKEFWVAFTAQNKVSIKDFFSKCDQIRKKLRIWSHLLKKSLMENFIFCAVFFF